jgi:hypothetical protein
VLVAIAASSVALIGCGATTVRGRPLPAYGGDDASVFDDAVEPAAIDLNFDKGYDPRADRWFKARARGADAVLRARTTTVSARSSAFGASYQLTLTAVRSGEYTDMNEVVGPYPPKDPFTITIDGRSSSGGMLKLMANGLVGKTFVVFVKEFIRPDGDKELHFHLAPDTKATIRAVSDAIATTGLVKE